MAVRICNSRTCDVEAFLLIQKFKDSLSYIASSRSSLSYMRPRVEGVD